MPWERRPRAVYKTIAEQREPGSPHADADPRMAPGGGVGAVRLEVAPLTLGRNYVALKVLPEAFTSDPDRLARFEREAKVLASLNHPNIGSIYGLEEAEGGKQRRIADLRG